MKATLTLLGTLLLMLAGAAVVVRLGLYDISATSSHTGSVYALLETTMIHSVRARAATIEAPPLQDPALLTQGAACYREHCVQCHGGPGVAQGDVGKSLQPLPGPLVDAARRWRPREIYWITRHGIKMSGMPAWELRLSDGQLWAVVGFVDRLALLSPQGYAGAMAQAQAQRCATASAPCPVPGNCTPTDTADQQPVQARSRDEQARLALAQYACVACHRIPGVVGPDTHVGPPLHELSRRRLLAGRLAGTPDNLARWIRAPQQIDPATAMPNMGVTEPHARLMADYLLKPR
ncbi:c-type cytochrome [Aquabacterium sp.]|uniref:c-type cytochrome n=1 Tax=Aquabacterium sp. TaxID=1872578 RepID=UPI002C576DA9|nr:c-type cytochrome [Aquabacterium sp.]HSW04301.1 c-type cytochrome [Aquabacterium sp.]